MTFQFLWGWNVVYRGISSLVETTTFQFLWGWNIVLQGSELEVVEAFNSFEDETTWRWSSTGLGSRYTFNSFEDETMFENMTDEYFPTKGFQFLWGWNWFGEKGNNFQKRLSIPLRMKPQRCGTCRVHCLPHLSIPLRMKPSRRLP